MTASYQRIRESYEVLGVDIGAPFDTVRRRYLELIKRWHPDVAAAAAEEAEKQAKRINEALDRIKSLSPAEIAAAQRHFGSGRRSSAGAPRRPWSASVGSAWRGTAAFTGRRGRDVFSRVRVTPLQAAVGSRWCFRIATCRHCGGWGAATNAEFRMCSSCRGLGLAVRPDGSFDLETLCPACQGDGCSYTRRCGSCAGTGARAYYTVRCYIPPLAEESVLGVLRGQGHRGFGDGEAGDLYLRISTGL